MVSSTSRRDRAQLLLIAAIAIAFIILGIAVALNTVLYTQTISSSNTVETAGDATQVELELEQGLQTVVQELNRNGASDSTIETAVEGDLADVYQTQTASSRPSLITVDRASVVEDGTMIVESASGTTTSGSDRIYNDSSEQLVGQFIVELDMTQFSTDFEIELGDKRTVDVRYDGTTVELDDGSRTCAFEPYSDEVTIDLFTGEATGSDNRLACAPMAMDLRGSYKYLEFDGPNGAIEGYEVVVEGTPSEINGLSGSGVAWSLEVDLTYESKELSVERTIEVDVYGDRL